MSQLNLTLEEREGRKRELAAARQQKFRDKKRNPIPDAWDYEMPAAWSEQLRKYHDEVSRKVLDELKLISLKDDSYLVEGVARITLAVEKNWTQRVDNPSGVLAGWYFPDAFASEVVRHIHKTRLLDSPTFAELYKRFIKTVAAFCDKAPELMTQEYVKEIKQELAGTPTVEPSVQPKALVSLVTSVPSMKGQIAGRADSTL